MKQLKLNEEILVELRDITQDVSTVFVSPSSLDDATRLLSQCTDAALAHVELLDNGVPVSEGNGLMLTHAGLDLTQDGLYFLTLVLIPHANDIPTDIKDKANGYDILTGGA